MSLQWTIDQLVPEVILKVENRITDTARARVWIRNSLLELTSGTKYRDDFDQLEIFGPKANLTIGKQEYSFSFLVPPQGIQSPFVPGIVPLSGYNLGTLDVLIWLDFPFNSIRRRLNFTHYQDADKFQQAISLPTEWYRFADTIGFNPVPNQTYQVQARMLQMHPINDTNLGNTLILIPREWNEVLEWSAAMRGYMELLEFEKAQAIRQMLEGDPEHPDKQGLIQAVKKRRKRESWRQEQPLRPIIRSYTWGGS
jgi:hypothetical protein